MEWGHEEAPQEPSRRRARQVERLSPRRGQETGQPRKWAQGRPGQKPQKQQFAASLNARRPRPVAQEAIEVVIASIRARFGDGAIGLGDCGIRFAEASGEGVSHARTA